jgi:hypothetical protein
VDPQVLLPPGAGLVVEQVQVCGEIIHLTVRCEAAGANCPNCGFWSEACHSAHYGEFVQRERRKANRQFGVRRTVVSVMLGVLEQRWRVEAMSMVDVLLVRLSPPLSQS